MTPWHFEYTLEGIAYRRQANSFDECVDALLNVRVDHPMLSGLRIFEGGTEEFGSGNKVLDSDAPAP